MDWNFYFRRNIKQKTEINMLNVVLFPEKKN